MVAKSQSSTFGLWLGTSTASTVAILLRKILHLEVAILYTTLQSLMNTKLSSHRFWPCHENGLIKTIQTIPYNLFVSVKSASLYCGLG